MMQMQDEERKGKWKEKLHSLVADEKYKKFIIIAGLAAIALIFISNFFDSGSKTQPSPEQTVYTSSQTALAYKQEIEASLQDIISSIEGAGTTKLYVTVDSGTEYVYAADEKESKSLQNGKGDGSTKTDESSDKEKTTLPYAFQTARSRQSYSRKSSRQYAASWSCAAAAGISRFSRECLRQ